MAILEIQNQSAEGNPAFSTVWNVLHSIGYTLTPTPITKTMQENVFSIDKRKSLKTERQGKKC